jgi:hypothetical protein
LYKQTLHPPKTPQERKNANMMMDDGDDDGDDNN